jgi:hypothetical protein
VEQKPADVVIPIAVADEDGKEPVAVAGFEVEQNERA